MNKGNCSSLVFIKFGKGRICVSLCVFCGKVGWEKVERVRRREGGGWKGCIYSCHYVDKNMIRTTKNICRSVKEKTFLHKIPPPPPPLPLPKKEKRPKRKGRKGKKRGKKKSGVYRMSSTEQQRRVGAHIFPLNKKHRKNCSGNSAPTKASFSTWTTTEYIVYIYQRKK